MCLKLNRSGNEGAKLLIAAHGIVLALNGIAPMAYAADAVGWRFDGKGEFKASKAPTCWSREEGVAWELKLPATSLSSPVVAGERAFVMAEPNRLLAIRLSDGELLWDRSHEYDVVFGPEKANEIKRQHAESEKVHQEIAELEKQLKSEQDADSNSGDVSSLRDRIRKLQQHDEELSVPIIIPPKITL